MDALLWLILILAVVILAPLVPYVLRKIDSRRQLRGDIPERKADENMNLNTPHPGRAGKKQIHAEYHGPPITEQTDPRQGMPRAGDFFICGIRILPGGLPPLHA